MFGLLVKKYASESWLLWLACASMLLVFPWVRIWIISQFELSGFGPLIEQFRAFEKFSPVPLEQFLTYEGVIGLNFDEPILILCILVWSISRGTDVVSGEIGRGTMEMLLAQPAGRRQIMLAHGTVSLLGLAALVLITYLGLWLGIQTNSTLVTQPARIELPGLPWEITNPFGMPTNRMVPLRELVSPDLFLPPTLNLLAFGFFVWALAVLMSSWDQYRWRSIGLVLGVYVFQLMVFVMAKSLRSLNWMKGLTFLGAYQPDWMVQFGKSHPNQRWSIWVMRGEGSTGHWGPMGYVILLMGLGAVLYLVALRIFQRRDIPAPL
jgi:ABC-2 type transport system permease protein